MFDEIKSYKTEKNMDCPLCGILLRKGEIMYLDEYRGETLCHHCIDDYKKEIISEEGIDGYNLK